MKKVSKIKTLLCVALTILCVGCLTALGVSGSNKANAASVDGFEMVLGSSIRTTGETGLRFQAELPSSLYKSDSTYGMFIAPEDYVSANALDETNLFGANAVYDWAIDGSYTGNKKRIINVTYSADELQASGNKYLIKGSILNVKESNLGRKFVGRAYVKTASGEITLASYASGSVENNTRSLYDVAFSVVGDETQDSATVNFVSNNYIDGMTKIVELAESDDYVEFFGKACGNSNSVINSKVASTSIPSGYTIAWTLNAQYGEQYHIFGNVNLDDYSILKFKIKSDQCDLTGWKASVTDWVEVKFVKTSTGWQGYRDGVKTDSWTVTGDFSSFNVGMMLEVNITELRGVKIPKFVPKYTVTYIDDNCQIIGTEKVSKGSAASASVELGSATVDGYTYEYANEWVLKDGSIADLSNVTSDMTVYPYGSAIAYKTYGGTVSSNNKSVETNYDNLNDFLGIENGKFEVYIRPTEFTTIGLMGLVDWNNPVAYASAKAGVWYKLVIEFGSDGVANAAAIYEDGVSIASLGADAVKGTYSTSKGIYVQVLNGAADIGAYIDGSTAKRHQVVYHDENGEVLALKIVKEGESAMDKYQIASEVVDGYTYEYSNVAWLDSFGDPIDVANVTNVTSDLNLFLSADKIAWKAYEDNDSKHNTIVNAAYANTHKNLTAITDGTIEVYVRMYAEGKIGFMELTAWDCPMAMFVGAGVYKMTLVMENGKGVSGSIVDVATGETKATLDATNAARYDASAGIWISVQKTIDDWTNLTYAESGKADIGVKTSIAYVPKYTITYHDTNGEWLGTATIKKGDSALDKITLPSETGTEYNSGYVNVSWVDENGDPIDIRYVTEDLSVYLAADIVSYKSYAAGQYDPEHPDKKSIEGSFTGFNALLEKTSDKFEVYIRPNQETIIGLMSATSWRNVSYGPLAANRWYGITIEYDSDGNGVKATFTNENGHVIRLVEGNNMKYDENSKYIFENAHDIWIQVVEGGADIGARVGRDAFGPEYTVTYHDLEGTLLATKTVKKGLSALDLVEVPDVVKDGYTYSYTNVSWVDAYGDPIDVTNVTSDLDLYLSADVIQWKNYEDNNSSSDTIVNNAYTNVHDAITAIDTNGTIEVYIKLYAKGQMAFMELPGWSFPMSATVPAGIYKMTLVMENGKGVSGSIVNVATGETKGTLDSTNAAKYDLSNGVWVTIKKTLDENTYTYAATGKADVGVNIGRQTYVPQYTISYNDEEGNLLHSEVVKKGEQPVGFTPASTVDADGYTVEYANINWVNSRGYLASFNNLRGDIAVSLSADKILWKAYEDNDSKHNTIVNAAYANTHKNLTAITDGTIEVYVRMYADGKIGFMDFNSWDSPMAAFVGAGVYKMTLILENGIGVSGSIVNVETEEVNATLNSTNAAKYVADKGIGLCVQKKITNWSDITYAATGKADVGVKATAVVEKNLALAVYNQYEQSKVQKDEGGRVNVYAVGEAVEFYEKITGKNLDVYYVDSLSDLPENEKFIVLGSELAALNGYTLTGLTTDTGYKITKDGDDVYLYGKTGYSTLNALYDLFNQTFGLEFFTDVVYTWDTAISSFDVSSVASKTFNPSIDKNWFHGAMEYIAPGETQPNWDYTHRLGFVNGWQEMSGGYHNFLNVLPYNTYKDAHPNWYTTASTPTESFTTLNLAYGLESADNNAMVNAVAQYIYDDFVASDAANNARDTFVFGQPDAFGWSASTESAAIKAKYGTNSAEAILFMKKVAERFDSLVSASTSSLSTEDRQFRLVIMAYGPTNEAPTAQTIAPNANLDDLKFYNSTKVKMGVMYCPIESNLYRSFDDDTAGYSEHNVDSSNVTAWTTAYARANTFYKQQMSNWNALLNGGDMLMYYYSAHYDNYFAPLDSVTNMQSKYALFASLGVADLYNLGQSGDDVYTDWTAFKVYMESKYAQDVKRTDSAALKTKFFKAYYGAAWQTMLNLYNAECEQYAAIADYYKKLQVADKQIGNLVLTHKDLNSDPSGCHNIRSFLFDKACWDSDGTILAGYCSSIDTALSQVEANSAEYDRIVVEGLVFRYLYYGMYGNSTYGDMAAIAADAKRVGIDKFSEGGFDETGNLVGGYAYTITPGASGNHYGNSNLIENLA